MKNSFDNKYDTFISKATEKAELNALKANIYFGQKFISLCNNKTLNKIAYRICKIGYSLIHFACFVLSSLFTVLEYFHFPFIGYKNPETGKWETFVPEKEEKKIIEDSIVKF